MSWIKQAQTKYRYSVILLRQMVITDFKLRYQGSVLGYLWSLLRPLFLFAILYVVFARFLNVGDDIPHYPVYLLLGIVLWNFFTEVTNGGVTAIVSQSDLIRKLSFPRYVIILASAFSALINLGLNLLVIVLVMAVTGATITVNAIWIPFLLIELFVFALAVSFILSALYVRLRDVNYIWEVVMQAMFYATPIIYPLTKIEWPVVAKLLMLNPVAQIIQDVRNAAVTPVTQNGWEIYGNIWLGILPIVFVVVVVITSVMFFKKRSPLFAEEV